MLFHLQGLFFVIYLFSPNMLPCFWTFCGRLEAVGSGSQTHPLDQG